MKISLGVTALLIVVLVLSVTVGSMVNMEGFEEEPKLMTPTKEEAALASTIKEAEAEKEKKESEENKADIKKAIATGPPAEEPFLTKQEQELFDQITENKIPSNDLEKLIRAGVLTENMVEKFLNQMDKLNAEKIEGFCAGDACWAPLK